MRGIYVLIITVRYEISLTVGALGRMEFEAGLYAYVGSAQSNLEQRIRRHLRKNKQLFWHIDYLLSDNATEISKVFVKNAARIEECALADALKAEGEPVKRFGSSDCTCRSHLFRVKNSEFLNDNMQIFYEKQYCSNARVDEHV